MLYREHGTNHFPRWAFEILATEDIRGNGTTISAGDILYASDGGQYHRKEEAEIASNDIYNGLDGSPEYNEALKTAEIRVFHLKQLGEALQAVKFKDAIIKYLLKEIGTALDSGLSEELLGGDIWIDTDDLSHSINIDIDWGNKTPILSATATVLKKELKGYITKDLDASEVEINFQKGGQSEIQI